MIYLHTYKNKTEITHDFYNHADNMHYSVSITTNKIRYYKVCVIGYDIISQPIEFFEYTMPEKLHYINAHNNKTRYEDLIDSKLRITLNSI